MADKYAAERWFSKHFFFFFFFWGGGVGAEGNFEGVLNPEQERETGSKQFQAVRESVITTVANNTRARLQPTARSLVQGSLVWNHHYAITKGNYVITSVLYNQGCFVIEGYVYCPFLYADKKILM